ncbi:hypothetical protein GCM10009563_33130 [Subtercola frigoramans]
MTFVSVAFAYPTDTFLSSPSRHAYLDVGLGHIDPETGADPDGTPSENAVGDLNRRSDLPATAHRGERNPWHTRKAANH